MTDSTKPCDGCGLCCMHMRTPPFIPLDGQDPSWEALPAQLEIEVTNHASRKTPISVCLDRNLGLDPLVPCLWFDLRTGRCREYAMRPDVCRGLDVGSDGCARARASGGLQPVEMAASKMTARVTELLTKVAELMSDPNPPGGVDLMAYLAAREHQALTLLPRLAEMVQYAYDVGSVGECEDLRTLAAAALAELKKAEEADDA